jgi:hypothetical protein
MPEKRYRSREWENQHPLIPVDKDLVEKIKKNVKIKADSFTEYVEFMYNVYINLTSQIPDEEFEEFIRDWRNQHPIKKKDIKQLNDEIYRRLENE